MRKSRNIDIMFPVQGRRQAVRQGTLTPSRTSSNLVGPVMKYLETNSTNPYLNLAIEEVILRNRREGDFLMLWQNDNTIVIGQNQNTIAEINQPAVEKYGVNVVRRSTGGGAVYHDLGNLNYSFITDEESGDRMAFEKFTKPVVDALKKLGLNADASGRNDILVDGMKVSGIAQRHLDGRILHHGTLLFSENLERAAEVLHADPEKMKSKGVKSVRSRITNIGSYLPGMTLKQFWGYVKDEFTNNEVLEIVELTPEEKTLAQKLHDEKYNTWEWNYGKSLAADIVRKERFQGGTVEVHMSTEHGEITGIKFYGDFLSLEPLDTFETALIGTRLTSKDLLEKMSGLQVSNYFGSVTAEEIAGILL